MTEQQWVNYESFRQTTNVLPCAIIIAAPSNDGDGIISFVNTYGLQMLGYTLEEIVGKPLTILIPEHSKKRHREGFALASKTGKINKLPRVVIMKRKNNTEVVIRLVLDCWNDDRGLRFIAAAIEVS